MEKIARSLFRSADLERYMETGVTTFRRTLKRNSVRSRQLRNLPVNLFGATMGIAGLSIAWRQASVLFSVTTLISDVIGVIAVLGFVTLAVFYLVKLFLFPKNVRDEFVNPVIGNFFGTIPISILLLSAFIRWHYKSIGEILWVTGLVLTIGLAYIIVDRLMKNKQDLLHATPAWLIPGVGTLDVAVTGSAMPFTWSTEANLFTFAIGSILALVFFTLIFSRLMHQDPMPERLTPSLIILIAPFEVGFLAYTNITDGIDMLASVLFYFGLFLFTIVFFKVFNKKLPFMLSWWAVGFPIAALSNASLKYAIHTGSEALGIIAGIILGILTLLITIIFFRTVSLLVKGKLLQG